MINHCDRHITHLSDLDISFVLLNISSKFLLHLECYLLSPNKIKQIKRYISLNKKSDTSITVIYHTMSLTVLYTFTKPIPHYLANIDFCLHWPSTYTDQHRIRYVSRYLSDMLRQTLAMSSAKLALPIEREKNDHKGRALQCDQNTRICELLL